MDTEQAGTCKYPGCDQPPAPADGPGRPPAYCTDPGHTAMKAWRERQRLAAQEAGATVSDADTEQPVTMARASALEMLREMRTLADRMTDLADRVRSLRRHGRGPRCGRGGDGSGPGRRRRTCRDR